MRVALLDRDGTIIVDKRYLKSPDEIEFLPGAVVGLRLLQDAGFTLAIVTNQSGVARGFFDEMDLSAIHSRLREMLAFAGIHIEAIYHCPHGPDDGCDCRKPRQGLLLKAMKDLGCKRKNVVMFGDSDTDMMAASAVGVRGVKLSPGFGLFEAARVF